MKLGAQVITPIVVGCIDYLFEWSDVKHQQTPFSYDLLLRNPTNEHVFLAIPFYEGIKSIPGDKLWLNKRPLGFGAAPANLRVLPVWWHRPTRRALLHVSLPYTFENWCRHSRWA
jgi:hypothetical protein